MAVDFDIKDAGILAGFELWGWPWHGLCTSGVIDLGGGLTKTITAPAHGSAWLIDLGLPAIERSAEQLLADAALGHEWRNYGMVSGGSVHGTALGENAFVHVDAAGDRWLISLTFSFPDYALQKARVTLSIVRFGLFGEGVKTPITVDVDVQCTYITYSGYSGYDGALEDVWTNGGRCIISIARTAWTQGIQYARDIYSLLEMTISGSGGADGSGLVISVVEVMQATELTQGYMTVEALGVVSGLSSSFTYTQEDFSECPIGGPAELAYVRHFTPVAGEPWYESLFTSSREERSVYARYAYYNAAGQPKAARLGFGYYTTWQYDGGSETTEGGYEIGCAGYPSFNTWVTRAHMEASGSGHFGFFLLENDTVIDSLSASYTASDIQDTLLGPLFDQDEPGWLASSVDDTGYGSIGGVFGIHLKEVFTESAVQWTGSLVGSLDLGPPPDGFGSDYFVRDGVYYDSPLMNGGDIIAAWRHPDPIRSAASTFGVGAAVLGILRTEAKTCAFFVTGANRNYGTIHTQLGPKTNPVTTAGNIYFAWNRKTGEFTFSDNPICYV